MSVDGPELLALALSLEADGIDDEDAVVSLVESAHYSGTALMAAFTYALSLARDLPYDPARERTLLTLTRAVQRAVRLSGEVPSEVRTILLSQIEGVAGQAAMTPGAVAARGAELDADLESLRTTIAGDASGGS